MNITRVTPALFSAPINNNPQKKTRVSFGKYMSERIVRKDAAEALDRFVDQFKKSKVSQELFNGDLAGAEKTWTQELAEAFTFNVNGIVTKKRAFFDYLQKLETTKKVQEFLNGSSKELRQAVEERNYNKALIAFEKQNASSFVRSKTAGATVQASIKNSLGELAEKVKPHSYDLSKEFDEIIANVDGLNYITIKSNNMIFADVNKTAKTRNIAGTNYTNCLDTTFFHRKCIHEGKLGYNTEQKVVRMQLAGEHPLHRPSIILVSPDANLTPAQKDLITVGKKMYSYIADDAERELTHELLVKLLSKKEDVNYDSILSVIQTLANKAG